MATTRAEVLAASRIHSFPHERGFDTYQTNQMKNKDEDVPDRGRPAQRGNVSRIKSMFQNDLDPKQQEDNRIAYNRNLGFGGTRSPEVKRKRGDLIIDANKPSGVNKKDVPSTLDTNLVDPQKFFETTSHVQRFQFTRAIFAQMEQKTKEEQHSKRGGGRKVSPNRYRAVSPTSPKARSPVRHEHNRKMTHPPASGVDNVRKQRSTSDPNHLDDNRGRTTSKPNIPNKPEYLRGSRTGSSTDSYGKRAGSVDRLDNDFSRRQHQRDDAGIQNRNLDSQRNSMSRSDSDLTREFSTEQRDNDSEDDGHVSARLLRQRYEDHDSSVRSRSSSQDARSNRFGRGLPDKGHGDDVFSSHPSLPSETSTKDALNSRVRVGSADNTHSSFSSDHSYHRPNRQISQDSASSDNSKPDDSGSLAGHKHTSREETTLSGRYRRLSQDEIKNAEKDHERLASWRKRVNKPDPASSGVLLHKRRSREEQGLSKDEIAASLESAESYWSGKFAHLPETSEAVDQTNTMTDSTYSSGSGEEMARSESGHNLVASGPTSPLEPEVKRRSWGRASPTNKRSSRGSDVMDDKVADEIAAQVAETNKRNSQDVGGVVDKDDLTYRYSAGSDNFVEKAEEATGYHSAHSSEENAFSRSSSEQSVIKRLSYSDDLEHGGVNGAPPPYPLGPGPAANTPFNNQNIPSPPPYTSPNSTPRVGDGTGQLAARIDTGVGGEGDGPYPPAQPQGNAAPKANLGIRKVPSPNESVESMTLSEQEALLSKA